MRMGHAASEVNSCSKSDETYHTLSTRQQTLHMYSNTGGAVLDNPGKGQHMRGSRSTHWVHRLVPLKKRGAWWWKSGPESGVYSPGRFNTDTKS